MNFKIVNNLGQGKEHKTSPPPKPVKEGPMRYISCKDFKGEVSSITGIYSKFLFTPKINQLSGTVETPTITIVCVPECKEHCINLKP